MSGLTEVRFDGLSSAPIGGFAIANTAGWQSWRTVPANVSSVIGTHHVYVSFTSGQPADYVNLNWISFGLDPAGGEIGEARICRASPVRSGTWRRVGSSASKDNGIAI